MDKRLTEILARVLARRDAGVLGDEEYQYLENLVARPAAASASETRPLWAWVHERLTRWSWEGFELMRDLDWGSEVNGLLADAGAPGAYETSAARWVTSTTGTPPARKALTAWRSAWSPASSRLASGSSSTTRRGPPYRARARPMRCFCPADRRTPDSPTGVW